MDSFAPISCAIFGDSAVLASASAGSNTSPSSPMLASPRAEIPITSSSSEPEWEIPINEEKQGDVNRLAKLLATMNTPPYPAQHNIYSYHYHHRDTPSIHHSRSTMT
ncbi:hypothetical protein WG66_010910 [Moniliophthora roreri]|nr:hypothetical protein WG66_010910 [Moniliophthora roreri]